MTCTRMSTYYIYELLSTYFAHPRTCISGTWFKSESCMLKKTSYKCEFVISCPPATKMNSSPKILRKQKVNQAPNLPEERYTQQVKLTIELGSEDINHKKALTRPVLRISVLAGKMTQMGALLLMAFTLQLSA